MYILGIAAKEIILVRLGKRMQKAEQHGFLNMKYLNVANFEL